MERRKRREPSPLRAAAQRTAAPERPPPDNAAPRPSRDDLARAALEPPDNAAPRPSRDDLARAALEPLAPGERPPALLVAIAATALLGLGNAIAYAAGATIAGKHPGAGVLAFTALMWLLAGGMWLRRYLAVLAFEALLALVVLVFTLYLIEADNVRALIVCVVVIVAAGAMFWKLVRVMGRLAAPRQSSS